MSLPASSADALESVISDALGGGGSWNKASELRWGHDLDEKVHEEL